MPDIYHKAAAAILANNPDELRGVLSIEYPLVPEGSESVPIMSLAAIMDSVELLEVCHQFRNISVELLWALRFAARFACHNAISWLVDKGVDVSDPSLHAVIAEVVDAPSEDSRTVMVSMALGEEPDISFNIFRSEASSVSVMESLTVLLDAGADPHGAEEERDALSIVKSTGRVEIANFMIQRLGLPAIIPHEFLPGAASYGRIETVNTLLSQGADPNSRNEYGNYALLLAAEIGSTVTVVKLLDSGANSEVTTPEGLDLTAVACLNGAEEIVDELISRNLPLERLNDKGISPLVHAVVYGHLEIARKLLETGVNPNVFRANDSVLSHIIGYIKHPSGWESLTGRTNIALDEIAPAIDLLLQYGLNVDTQTRFDNYAMETLSLKPKEFAAIVDEVFTRVLAHSNSPQHLGRGLLAFAKVARDDLRFKEIVVKLLDAGVNPEVTTPEGYDLTAVACLNGAEEIVDELIRRHLPLERLDDKGVSPLIHAVSRGHMVVARKLLDAGVNPNAFRANDSALSHIIDYIKHPNDWGGLTAIDLLLQYGLNVDTQTQFEEYVLEHLSHKPRELAAIIDEVFARVLAHSNSPEHLGRGVLAFTKVAREDIRFKELVVKLLNAGVNLEVTTQEGHDLMAVACLNGAKEVVDELISRHLPLERKDDKGIPPLIHAIVHRHLGIARKLLEAGADPNVFRTNDSVISHIIGYIKRPDDWEVLTWIDLLLHYGLDVDTQTQFEEYAMERLSYKPKEFTAIVDEVFARVLENSNNPQHLGRALLAFAREAREDFCLRILDSNHLLLRADLDETLLQASHDKSYILVESILNYGTLPSESVVSEALQTAINVDAYDIGRLLIKANIIVKQDLYPFLELLLDQADGNWISLFKESADIQLLEVAQTERGLTSIEEASTRDPKITEVVLKEILSEQILSLPSTPDRSERINPVALFKQSQNYQTPNWSSQFRLFANGKPFMKPDPLSLRDGPRNDTWGWDFTEIRDSKESSYTTAFRVRNVRSGIRLFGRVLKLEWYLSMQLTIVKTAFSFPEEMNAYPLIEITNRGSSNCDLIIEQTGMADKTLLPGKDIRLDRSAGDIVLSMKRKTSDEITLYFEVRVNIGPKLKEFRDFHIPVNRLSAYLQLYRLRNYTRNPNNDARMIKSTWSAIRYLSSTLVANNVDHLVSALLAKSRDDLVSVQLPIANLRRFFYEHDDITLNQLPELELRINRMFEDQSLDSSLKAQLEAIVNAVRNATNTADRAARYRDLFQASLFENIAEEVAFFQTRILEAAQYISDSEIATELNRVPDFQQKAAEIILSNEYIIEPDSLGGRGQALLSIIGG